MHLLYIYKVCLLSFCRKCKKLPKRQITDNLSEIEIMKGNKKNYKNLRQYQKQKGN